ncbi:MAG TPA: DUF190 domain-containing protein [Solirubrobacteraceae bacterium]|nr:DUF190 domain-containing protein [Solirubrobacteraceae bacterium]
MNEDCLSLTVYFGERDSRGTGTGFLADELSEIHARHGLPASILLRGVEGFGAKQRLRTDRVLTLSEDLPVVSVAVGTRPRVEAALAEVSRLSFDGLVTLERARLLGAPLEPQTLDPQAKLTVYLGRHERTTGGRAADQAVVELLHRRGVAGATVLLGVDGTLHGERRRAAFFGRNAFVPTLVIAVGDGKLISAVVADLAALLQRPLMTLERVEVCKRDGQLIAAPRPVAEIDDSGLGVWQKLTIYAGEQSRAGAEPLYHRLVRALREAGAAGATTLRGVRGYHGDHEPHGDRLWQLRRRVPVMTVVVDTPRRCERWFELIDSLTMEGGLVTSETVPAFRASGPGIEDGGLALASPR